LLADKRGIRVALLVSFLCGIATLWMLSLDLLYALPILALALVRGMQIGACIVILFPTSFPDSIGNILALRSLTNFHLPLIDTFALSNADRYLLHHFSLHIFLCLVDLTAVFACLLRLVGDWVH
jgi:hypothetical protein